MSRITDLVNKQLAAQEAVDAAVTRERDKLWAKDGVNYCRCCGGDAKSVGPLNIKGVCGDCTAEYSKPEYHEDYRCDEEPEAEVDEGE